ncbi:hypothetical protein AAVH_20939 [Aphelenchoides avenae]|nr:hypothetical protein AAVH_20939 [Aphelenchus avenae]
MVKRFLRTGRPDKDWKPLTTSGSGYFVLDFRVQNGTLEEQPHFEDRYFYPASLKFWLSDLAKVDAMAGGLALANGFGLQALSTINAYRVEGSQVQSSDATMEDELRRTFWTEIVLTAMGLILLALYLSYRFTGVTPSASGHDETLRSEQARLITQGYTVKYS